VAAAASSEVCGGRATRHGQARVGQAVRCPPRDRDAGALAPTRSLSQPAERGGELAPRGGSWVCRGVAAQHGTGRRGWGRPVGGPPATMQQDQLYGAIEAHPKGASRRCSLLLPAVGHGGAGGGQHRDLAQSLLTATAPSATVVQILLTLKAKPRGQATAGHLATVGHGRGAGQVWDRLFTARATRLTARHLCKCSVAD
jgi:hypothetical protein